MPISSCSQFGLLSLLTALVLASTTAAEEAVTNVSYADLGKSVEITGSFGQPLGKIIALEGQVLEEFPYKFQPRGIPFEATHVDGRQLERPIIIGATDGSFEMRPSTGTKISTRGYETGEMVGMPPDVADLVPRVDFPSGPRTWVAIPPWRFSLRFVDATDSPIRRSPPPARSKLPALR